VLVIVLSNYLTAQAIHLSCLYLGAVVGVLPL
jgi:hypothetical protein